MRRRQVLAATAGATALPPVGCLGLGSGSVDLDRTREEVEADGMEKHLVFTRDDTEQVVITIQQRLRPASPDQRIPFRLVVWHRQGLSIDRLYSKLRAPPNGVGVPADIYLKIPDGDPWPAFDLHKEDNLWSVIAVDDIGELGDGTLGLDLIIDLPSEPVDTLAVNADVEFSNKEFLGPRYRASVNTRFDLVYEEN